MRDFSAQPSTPNNPYYISTRAWLSHISLMAELPYPSWALMPSIGAVVRAHIPCAVMNFGWADLASLQPLATWVHPLKPMVYQRFLANPQEVFDDVPIKAMRDSHGRFLQMVEALPEYEQAPIFKDMLSAYGARWGLSTLVTTSKWFGFMTLYRQAALGPYAEEDWGKMMEVGQALSRLDDESPLAEIPTSGLREAVSSTLLLTQDGSILSQSPAAQDMLFLARQTGMGPPEWARDDWHAMPNAVVDAAKTLFESEAPFISQKVTKKLPWGQFDFSLEKMQTQQIGLPTLINVTISHHEPLDIAVARHLWGWPMSPQEKRILIASARNASLEQLAKALNISLGTLKNYANELLTRFDVPTRQGLITKVLSTNILDF